MRNLLTDGLMRSPIGQSVLTRHGLGSRPGPTTPPQDAFAAWFGNSVVRDADGRPKVVYHGTEASIDTFAINSLGAYFSCSPEVAEAYAGFDGHIVPVYLSLQHPLVVDALGNDWHSIPYTPRIRAEARRSGFAFSGYEDGTIDTDTLAKLARAAQYDGVVIHNIEDNKARAGLTTEYIALGSDQIKSAIGNRGGTYDISNPDIRFRRASASLPATALAGIPNTDSFEP
ncbi:MULTISPECIES: ADP-ribosyltransferase-containing protein [Cupriavidus]